MATAAIQIAGQAGNFIMSLLAAHDKRLAEAKAENSAVNAALSALIHDAQVIADGFNSGALSPAAAIQACLDVDMWYWAYINPYTQYKNAVQGNCSPNQLLDNPKLNSQGGRCYQSNPPSKTFTAGPFLGCNIVDANLGMLRAALISLQNAPPGTTKNVNFCGWSSDKYGLTAYGGMTLKLTVPSSANPEELTISSSGILNLGTGPTSASDAVIAPGAIVGGSTQNAGLFPSGGGTLGLSMSSLLWLLVLAIGAYFLFTLGGRE